MQYSSHRGFSGERGGEGGQVVEKRIPWVLDERRWQLLLVLVCIEAFKGNLNGQGGMLKQFKKYG